MNKILVTGSAGFIGFHLCKYLLSNNAYEILGIDNLNDYYDIDLKKSRLKILKKCKGFTFNRIDITNSKALKKIFDINRPKFVIHLAAQAGVRYSLKNPECYIDSNIKGFFNIIDISKNYDVKHFIYASSSSVYGMNPDKPFKTNHHTSHPISLYAATKKTNEILAHSYSHLYKLPTTGLRFFTVYGQWGRPDMAYYLFAHAIKNNVEINLYNNGKMQRDFTHIDDVVQAIEKIINIIPCENNKLKNLNFPDESKAPFKIYNIGNNKPIKLSYLIKLLEKNLNKKARKIFLPMQPGDVKETFSDNEKLENLIGFNPSVKIEKGIEDFVKWFNSYHS